MRSWHHTVAVSVRESSLSLRTPWDLVRRRQGMRRGNHQWTCVLVFVRYRGGNGSRNLASAPVLETVTDMVGSSLVVSLASAMLAHLTL